MAIAVWLGSALALALLVATFGGPGYVDAEYAYHVAVNLAAGRGFTADVSWTYLTDPAGLPTPSHLYWMPLTSILAAPFVAIFGPALWAAEIPFVVLGAAVPAATTLVARRVFGTTWQPLAAGALTLGGGYYFLYWAAIDAFASFTLAAGMTFLATAGLLAERLDRGRALWLGALLGAGTAVAHLARADGPLLLVAALLTLVLYARSNSWLGAFGVGLTVYLGLMTPWWLRNLAVAGAPFPAEGLQTIFLREYADLFAYGQAFGPVEYLRQGPAVILAGKLAAAARNLLVFFGGAYWLTPFALAGWWSLRRLPLYRAPLVYAVLLYLVMTFVFTAPSGYGSLLHSAAALIPWLAIATVRGVEIAARALARWRPAWQSPGAARFLTLVLTAGTVVASIALARGAVGVRDEQIWAYSALAAATFAGRPAALVFVLDPPGWWYATGGRALMTPSNGPAAAIAAATRYGATHLIWQPGYPPVWQGIDQDPRFRQIAEHPPYRVYEVMGSGQWAVGSGE